MAQRRSARRIALTLSLVYAAAGALWILLSDHAVTWLSGDDVELFARIQLFKGWLYVTVTAAALYAFSHVFVRRQLVSRSHFESLVDATALAVWRSRSGVLEMLRASQPSLAEPRRRPVADWWDRLHPSDAEPARRHVSEQVAAGAPIDYEARLLHRDGQYRWVHVRGVPVLSSPTSDREWIGTISDIHQRKVAEQALRETAESLARLANLDDLTGLPNRRLMREMLSQAVRDAAERGHSVALMMMDLDHFKLVNDTLGHAAGDQLLREAAQRLRECVRDRDQLARLGGDEFTILVSAVDDEQQVSVVAERVIRTMEQPFELDGREVLASATLGIALYPADAPDAEGLQRRADLALYAGKSAGRGVYRYFTPELETRSIKQMQLETGLRKAVERGEIELRMRPMFRIADNALTAVDVEAWWRHPQLGLLAPQAYRGVAEQSRQGDAIAEFLMDETVRQLARWRASGATQLRAPVHVSARRLSDRGLIRRLQERVGEAGLHADAIIVSFSEGELMGKASDAVGVLDALSRQGFRIAIERFGTGSSNLADLKRFPLNAVRIDASYVRDIPDDADDAAIVRSMIGLAHNFGVTVVADGVDGPQQLQFLRDNGCDMGSGNVWAKPMKADHFDAWLLSHCDQTGRAASL